MNKAVIGGLAIVTLAGGIIALATGAVLYNRAQKPVALEPIATEVDPDYTPARPPKGANADWLKRYTLTDQFGKEFESEQMTGEVHVVSFFFSSCPSVCWLQNQQVKNLQNEFHDEGVQFISITCDPARDKPAVLKQYAQKLGAKSGWWFLTSPDLKYLERIAAEIYTVSLQKQTHSSRLLLIDRNGETRGTYHYNEPEEMSKMKQMIRVCLQEEMKPKIPAEEPPSPE